MQIASLGTPRFGRKTQFILASFLLVSLCFAEEDIQIETRQNNNAAAGASCTTPSNQLGHCVNIRRCQVLFDLLLTRSRESAVATLLRRSQCGYEGRDPKVCCPTTQQPSVSPTTSTSQPIRGTTPEPDYSQCGKNNGSRIRIVGGQPAELGSWPWIAALGYRSSTRRGPDFRCGGTLISNRHVLTASHCVTNTGGYQLSVVRLGDLNLDDTVSDGASPIDIPVERIITHQGYTANPVSNDIALVKLQEAVRFNRFIRPVCLPSHPQLRADSFDRRQPFIMGWGATAWRAPATNALQEAQVPTIDIERCKQNYAQERGAMIDERVICAGGGGKDTCQGDSGGPLILPNATAYGTTYYIIGIVSFGIRCAEPNYPGVYTRITHFLDWINENMT